jgi:hypothetical protein
MSIIVCALVYVFVASRFTESVKVAKSSSNIIPELPVEKNGIEVVEISGKNSSENVSRRKRLDSDESDQSPDSQKLVFFPSREIKPPRIKERSKVVNFPQIPQNHRISSRMTEPRPFRHMQGFPRPNGFQVPPATVKSFSHAQVSNIHDIIRQNQLPTRQKQPKRLQHSGSNGRFNNVEQSSIFPVKIAGTYRQPRRLHTDDSAKQATNQHETTSTDPFFNYKPNSPHEINNQLRVHGLMTTAPTQNPYFRRKFRHEIASIPNYNIKANDVAGIYENILSSGKKVQVDRNEIAKSKPGYQLMLDVYPLNGNSNDQGNDESDMNQMQQQMSQFPMHPMQAIPTMQSMQPMQYPQMPRIKPFQGFYQDPSFFNTMPFPQVMPRYPTFYHYPQMQPEASNMHQINFRKKPNGMKSAQGQGNQLVVHLNLYPKNKAPFKRSSTEENHEMKKMQAEETKVEPVSLMKNDEQMKSHETTAIPLNINFNVNTNGHPENIHHQQVNIPRDPYHKFNISTDPTFKPNYFYDEAEDDHSLAVAPSLIYQTIHRDRPYNLMLRSTTEKTPQKTNNHKHTYQTIERPRKEKIKNGKQYGNIFQ